MAQMQGSLGYFPDVVHLRPSSTVSKEKFEVAEIMSLRAVRYSSRSKR
ncbi:MAG: CRISPR-associated protein Csx15 [Chlorobiaceae bacterium]